MFSGKAQGLLFETLLRRFERKQRTPQDIRRGAQILHGRLRSIDRCTIMAVQQIRLQRMVDYLEGHSEYYRQLFRRTGIRSDDIRSADDLSGLPLTHGNDLRDRESDIRCIPENSISASFLSSGTSGKPKRVDYSFEDVQAAANNGATLVLSEHGDAPLVAAIAMPVRHGLWIGWRQSAWIIEKAGGLALTLGDEDPSLVAEKMCRYRCNMLMSSPSFMLRLIDAFGTEEKPPLTRIILGSERLDAKDLEAVRAAFPTADVHTSYGTTELGVGLAFSWKNERSIIFDEVDLVVEIVDPETGEPEDEGELVFSTMSRRAMPLLRYQSGDRARWADHGAPYALRAVEILGRTDDVLVVAGSKISAEVIAVTVRDVAGGQRRRVAVSMRKGEGHQVLHVSVEGEIDADALQARLFERAPRLRDHVRARKLTIEIVSGADLGGQVKPLSVSQLTD